jgi:hypothetical protein
MRFILAILLLIGALSLVGCPEYGYRMNELYGLNCRPAVVQEAGSCVAMKQETKR